MEVRILESNDIERMKTMVKNHAIMMICTILALSFKDAEKVYQILFN